MIKVGKNFFYMLSYKMFIKMKDALRHKKKSQRNCIFINMRQRYIGFI